MSMQSKHFQITMNKASLEWYEELKDYLLNEKKATYLLSCLEENSKGELHIHIYVQFNERTRLASNKCYHSHIEMCKGSTSDNQNYILKIKKAWKLNNILDEIGIPTMIANKREGIKNEMLVKDLENIEYERVTIKQFKTWKEINSNRSYKKDDIYKKDVEVVFLWGESGSGKSRRVFTDFIGQDEEFDRVKFSNGFWLGVNTLHPVNICWYDDFRPSDMKPNEFINFIDYYKNQMNIKFVGNWVNHYTRIYITSIFDPREMYAGVPEETREQWIRRMQIIHVIGNPF